MQYKDRNLVVNFSNTYSKEIAESLGDTDWVDCSDISGTNMYCTDDAANEIKRRLEGYSPNGVHFIDSGNYHYMTEFFVEKLEGKFSLVLFDYHNDMQVPMIHSFTSCGDWAREVLENNDNLEQLILIGPSQKNIDDIEGISKEKFDKLVCVSLRDLEEKVAEEKLELIKNDVPLYVSIDKDVLSKHYAKTNTTINAIINGIALFIISSIFIFVIVLATNKFTPSGGVTNPIAKLTPIIIPK